MNSVCNDSHQVPSTSDSLSINSPSVSFPPLIDDNQSSHTDIPSPCSPPAVSSESRASSPSGILSGYEHSNSSDSFSDTSEVSDVSEVSEVSEQEDFLANEDLLTALYPDANITLVGALCAIMKFCIANKLTYMAIDELLKLLCILSPQTSRSFYKFKKFFQQFTKIDAHQQICIKCNRALCVCESQSPSEKAHVVHLNIQRPLENILSSKFK